MKMQLGTAWTDLGLDEVATHFTGSHVLHRTQKPLKNLHSVKVLQELCGDLEVFTEVEGQKARW